MIFQNFRQGRIEDFYTYLYPDMLVYASSLPGGNEIAMAEDWVQDAVEKAYLNKEKFSSAAHWKAFMITCVRNKAISGIRVRTSKQNYIEYSSRQESITDDILSDYIELETRTRLFNAIATLPEELRQIFNLGFEEGLRNQEIAERLGVAVITVKKRKARMIGRLRELLGVDPTMLLLLMLLETDIS